MVRNPSCASPTRTWPVFMISMYMYQLITAVAMRSQISEQALYRIDDKSLVQIFMNALFAAIYLIATIPKFNKICVVVLA